MAQRCVRDKGNSSCPYHPGQKVILRCVKCPGNTLVCPLCIATFHNEHKMTELKYKISERVDKIMHFIKTSEQLTIPRITKEIYSITKKTEGVVEVFQAEIKEAQKHAEHFKELVDLSIAKRITELESCMKEIIESMDVHKKALEEQKKNLVAEIKDSTETVQSGDDILVIDTEADIEKRKEDVVQSYKEKSALPHFLPYTNPKPLIEKAFGELVKGPVHTRTLLDENAPVSTKDLHRSSPITTLTKQNTTSYSGRMNRQQQRSIEKTIPSSQFMTACRIYSILHVPDTMAWICGEYQDEMQLVNDRGEVQFTLKLDVKISRMCLRPSTRELYCCCIKDKSIRRINRKNGKTTVLCRTEAEPWSIACTHDHVVVGLTDIVRMYTNTGDIVYTYSGYIAYCISVCTSTNRIALACYEHGLILLDDKLQMITRYQGESTSDTMERVEFRPYSAAFDDNGYLIVDDALHHSVRILDGSLHHVKTLHIDNMPPIESIVSLGTHKGVIWIGCDTTDTVMCIRYK